MDCIFCKIIQREIPGRLVYEDKKVLCFKDINPKAPVHVLIVPKKHIESLIAIEDQDKDLLGYMLLKIRDIATKLGIDDSGYKIIANNGKGSGQLVFHLHFHLLGGWKMSPDWEI